ncbi:hypothetical protein [Roseateles violae]|uniref:hypothetical protein n=1 Tax=Roseateles violae TaxID=3058042 RepID=UPI003D9C77A0
MADLSACTAATQIKTGSPCRSDRMAKYNRRHNRPFDEAIECASFSHAGGAAADLIRCSASCLSHRCSVLPQLPFQCL